MASKDMFFGIFSCIPGYDRYTQELVFMTEQWQELLRD
jgi:hypothetical protein